MVATKPVASTAAQNNKRRGGFNGSPNRQRFKPGGGPKHLNARSMGVMFDANQLGDNPGFVDFNDDVQIPTPSPATTAPEKSAAASGTEASGSNSVATDGGKGPNQRKPPNQRRPGPKNGNMRRMPPGMNGFWGPPWPPMFPPMMGGRRNGPFPPVPPHFRPPMGMRGMRNGPMMPPPGRFGGPPMGPGPMGMMPRPMPPMPPMRGGPMMGPMGRMMPPPLRNRSNGGPGGMRRNPNGKPQINKQLKGAPPRTQPNGGIGKPPINRIPGGNNKLRSKRPAKPREEFPLDKPWVTEEIKAEHDKKVEIADRLKGNKDDVLFAQYKEQLDKFVKMYEAARLEFIGKHPEQDVDKILTEPPSVADDKSAESKSDAVSTTTDTDTSSAVTDSTTVAAVAAATDATTNSDATAK
ncbi:DNA-binding protein K10-like [Uranotaenia lowii]|uniref:DNA-binding protein K10-like n=1 Tax=Uranotaenia lowii TaxID=190385 RepID=UPI0024783373|nr:DNA-binding protein K10-like [Uranotaenia lowii]